MTHPQTLAKELNKIFPNSKLNAIAEYGCCAFTLIWCIGIECDDIDAIKLVAKLMDDGAISDCCIVRWKDAINALTGKTMTSIDFLDTKVIGNIKERTPVRFDYGKSSHWVGVENGKVVFNSLEYSNCVTNGRPGSKRVIHLKGDK